MSAASSTTAPGSAAPAPTRKDIPPASVAASASSRLLPIPGTPSTSTTAPTPERTRSSWSVRVSSAASRPLIARLANVASCIVQAYSRTGQVPRAPILPRPPRQPRAGQGMARSPEPLASHHVRWDWEPWPARRPLFDRRDPRPSCSRRKSPAGRHGGTGHQVDRRRPRCRPSGQARRAGRAPHASLSEAIKGAGLVALGRAIDVPNRRPTRRPAASSR